MFYSWIESILDVKTGNQFDLTNVFDELESSNVFCWMFFLRTRISTQYLGHLDYVQVAFNDLTVANF